MRESMSYVVVPGKLRTWTLLCYSWRGPSPHLHDSIVVAWEVHLHLQPLTFQTKDHSLPSFKERMHQTVASWNHAIELWWFKNLKVLCMVITVQIMAFCKLPAQKWFCYRYNPEFDRCWVLDVSWYSAFREEEGMEQKGGETEGCRYCIRIPDCNTH